MKKLSDTIVPVLVVLLLIVCSNNKDIAHEGAISTENSPSTSAMDLCNQLYESYQTETKGTGESDKNYPEYFGGCYVDNERLITLIKGDIETGKKEIYKRIGKFPTIEFKECLYSLNSINALKDELKEAYANESLRKELGWTSVGVSIKENRIIVYLEDCSGPCMDSFRKKVSNAGMIMFDELSDVSILTDIIPDSAQNGSHTTNPSCL